MKACTEQWCFQQVEQVMSGKADLRMASYWTCHCILLRDRSIQTGQIRLQGSLGPPTALSHRLVSGLQDGTANIQATR